MTTRIRFFVVQLLYAGAVAAAALLLSALHTLSPLFS